MSGDVDWGTVRESAIRALSATWDDDTIPAKVDAVLRAVETAGRIYEDYSAKVRRAAPITYWQLLLCRRTE